MGHDQWLQGLQTVLGLRQLATGALLNKESGSRNSAKYPQAATRESGSNSGGARLVYSAVTGVPDPCQVGGEERGKEEREEVGDWARVGRTIPRLETSDDGG